MPGKPYKIEWRGPLHRLGGLGHASREYVKALKRRGITVHSGSARRTAASGLLESKRGMKVLIYHYPPHTLDMARERRRYGRIILNTVWETSRIPARWIPAINEFDAVFVPTRHNVKAMRESGVRVPLYIVPHGVDTAVYNPSNAPKPIPGSKGRFVFLSVFGFQHRKNPETLLRAYWEEFTDKDNVMLVIKTGGYGPKQTGEWIRSRIARYKASLNIPHKTAPLVILTGLMNEKKLKGLYTAADVFVLPTRGEGVGMPFMEAMASGIPVIATAWGGHMDFVKPANSFLIPYRLKAPAASMKGRSAIAKSFRHLFADERQRWAEADLRKLKELMRKASRNPALCRAKGQKARGDMLRLGWDKAGSVMEKAIDSVIRG